MQSSFGLPVAIVTTTQALDVIQGGVKGLFWVILSSFVMPHGRTVSLAPLPDTICVYLLPLFFYTYSQLATRTSYTPHEPPHFLLLIRQLDPGPPH